MIAASLLNPMRDALRKIRADDYHTSQPLFDRGAASRREWGSFFIRHDSLDEMTLPLK